MCGRYTLVLVGDELIERFKVEPPSWALTPRYNIAPAQHLPIITTAKPHSLTEAVWGYQPKWMTNKSTGVINARSETIARKPFFKSSLIRRRCLIPADGFYEWDHHGRSRQPYRFTPQHGGLFAFAGVYEEPDTTTKDALPSYALITTSANDVVGQIHDRMPVILESHDEQLWLDPNLTEKQALALLQPLRRTKLVRCPVSTLVNSATIDEPSVIRPLTKHAAA